MAGKQYEAEGIAKHGAKLVNAVATILFVGVLPHGIHYISRAHTRIYQ